MSDDIKKILTRLDEALTPVSVKKGLNPQQRSVPQLPADFQPRKIRALGAARDPRHPMTGLAVGAAESRMPTPAKTRNPVAKNAPRSGAGAHANKKRADRHGEVKHKKSAAADDEIKEMQHRPEQAVMILRRIPEGYRGARLYEKIMNTIVKRLGPAGPTAERREFYQTLAADVMERYVQKYPASAAVREDRAQNIKMSDAIDAMINGLETAKVYITRAPGGQDRSRQNRAVELLDDIRQQFLDTFRGRARDQWLDDFLTPLDWCADTLSSGAWNPEAMTQTLDICINLLSEMNDQIWREIVPAKDDDEGGISVGDLSENYDDEEDEEDQEDAGFFVVISSEDDGVFIGYVAKEDGRWYEQRVSGQPPYAWGGPKYMGYLTPRDVMSWIRRDYERHHEVKGPFADEESARDYAEQYLGEGVSEGTLKESGETYVWTAHFGDGSTEQLRIATDEVPYARAAFEKKFPNKELVKVDTDWKPQDDGYGAMPAARYTEPRPQPDNPMVREAWTLRGSKTQGNLEVKVYHDAERGRWALQMFVDGEYRPDQTQHFDSAQDAKEALRILMNFGLKESPAMKDLSEAIAEIEEDMLSKVRNDLTRYLDRLEKKVNKDRALRPKDDKTMDEDPTAVDTMSVPPPAPVQNPVMPESVAVKSIALEDGTILEIHGDQLRGFEVRRGGRSLATRFPNLDHAQMAVDLYRRRRGASDPSADYVEER